MAVIVLADDDMDVRAFIKLVLEDRGDTCLDFSNGDDALAALGENKDAGLLISDIRMPAGDGRDLLEILRKGSPRFRSMPVLMISGLVPEETMEDILQDGLCQFLQKPFLPADLYEAVDRLLGKGG